MRISSLIVKITLGASAFASLLAISGCGGAPSDSPAASQTHDPGRRAFSACAVCHGLTPPAEGPQPGKIGPTLYGVVGRPSGAISGYGYSRALREADFVWDEARLDAFIAFPPAVVRGNRMSFEGEPDPAVRAAIIEYLKSVPATP